MITLKVCPCGLSHDTSSWSSLGPVSRFVRDGDEWQERRCSCGRVLAVTMREDDCATEIAALRFRARYFYGHAALALAMARCAQAQRHPVRLKQFLVTRAEARRSRADAQRLESVLRSIYWDRERKSPALRIGRNLVVIGGDVDEQADRVRAAR
jgi:hypothetical protein